MSQGIVRVKMCGMTRSEDIAHAIQLGVHAIGLIFYAKSVRCVSIEQARVLLKNIPPFVDPVAVLVNPEPDFVTQIIDELPIQILQFHGDERPEFCQQFNRPYIKAIHPASSGQILQAEDEFISARALLLDTPSTKAKGGTGVSFDWQIIPETGKKPYVLAGGLNDSNVLEAIQTAHPYALDLCSSIESSPGIKDHDRMSRFMQRLRVSTAPDDVYRQ